MAPQIKENNILDNKTDSSLRIGSYLANPPKGDEVIISGMAGSFPGSKDVQELADNLFNKNDLMSGNESRWTLQHPEIPPKSGKIKNIEYFDAGFFGCHYRKAKVMDPMVRILLECAIEAICDAGVNPKDLENTNTGVFVGSCFGETEVQMLSHLERQMICSIRSMIPRQLSYYLKLKGPSYVTDTACSSSFYALEHAFKSIRMGQCDQAIVGGTNLCLHPFVTMQFFRLGVLSKDAACKSFDNSADGYSRSETISAIFLQNAKNARRIYAQIIHIKTNCDGFKDMGINYPSGEMQQILLEEVYRDCGIDPSKLSYLEAHGTGTKVGDPEELIAMDKVFGQRRDTPLFIGSVKSNLGHSEPSSGLCSLIKCIIAMETGFIPPNINFKTVREGVKAFEEGRFVVVTEKTPFSDDRGLIGINNFGFGGANCHLLIKRNNKDKIKDLNNTLPRLICVSGRIEETVKLLLDDALANGQDMDYIALLWSLFRYNHEFHFNRGYSIVNESEELCRSIKYYNNKQPKLHFLFGDIGSNWQKIGQNLMVLKPFASSLERMQNYLPENTIQLILGKEPKDLSVNILGNLIVQIGIVDLIKELKIVPDSINGYGLGEIMCAYYDNVFTLKEVVEISCTIATFLKTLKYNPKIYLVTDPIKTPLNKSIIRTAITNNSYIVSENGTNFTQSPETGIKELNLSLVNLHTEEMRQMSTKLICQLSEIIQESRQWSPKRLNVDKKMSPKNLVNLLTNMIPLHDICQSFNKNDVVLEIGSGQLLPLVKLASIKDIKTLQIINAETDRTLISFLEGLGSLYELGINAEVQNLYPKIEFPVGRGTPMISHRYKWNHKSKWEFAYYDEHSKGLAEKLFSINSNDANWKFLTEHVIDDRHLYPAMGYLQLVWQTFIQVKHTEHSNLKVVLENCKFLRATNVPTNKKLKLTVMIQGVNGNFEVIEGDTPVVTGKIYKLDEEQTETSYSKLPLEEIGDELELKTKDIYKELRLRGYNYKGTFKKLMASNISGLNGLVKWEDNLITFMDNMLQMRILNVDTRLLYVPTGIDKVILNIPKHTSYVESIENSEIPVVVYPDSDIIKSGGIEIHGVKTSSIARRKIQSTPVLENYIFVPNVANLDLIHSVRVNMQLILENKLTIKVNIIELVDEATDENYECLSTAIMEVLEDLPLVQPEITILSKRDIEIKDVTVENSQLTSKSDHLLIVAKDLLSRKIILNQCFGALKQGGYIISRESLNFDLASIKYEDFGINLLTIHKTSSELMLLLTKLTPYENPKCTIEPKNDNFSWLQNVQKCIKNKENVVLYARDYQSGILGLANCIKQETLGQYVQCVFIMDENIQFIDTSEEVINQLKKKLVINVYKNGQWGTYRHLPLNKTPEILAENCYVNNTVRGDLSSFKWLESSLTSKTILQPQKNFVQLYYSALNFRDVMIASGRINNDAVSCNRLDQLYAQGFEYSGRNEKGVRVMGMVMHSALSTAVEATNYVQWKVPDNWTLAEAATVPVVYTTCLFALLEKGKMKRGDSVLIHSGAGGIGQAGIHLALHYGCIVFTTVGNDDKREFLKNTFPQLSDKHIFNSRNLTFEQNIMKATSGRGVDIVLNSLAEEKQIASLRCLAHGGRFLEIGKFDILNDATLNLLLFQKEASIHGIMLDQVANNKDLKSSKLLCKLVNKALRDGAVKPLKTNIFQPDEVEKAYRYMASGTHVGKNLIEIRKEENQKICLSKNHTIKCFPRYYCDPQKTYIVIGGLGGFGLELTDWLILRGARNVVLTSRNGIKNGYQKFRMNFWKQYGVNVIISKADVITIKGCEHLIEQAEKFGSVHAIFNLAVVLQDSIFENQTTESFQKSFDPKAVATKNLDLVSKRLCPNLRDFVVFSSVSCGRGNAGQSNYGMSNSVMERICEQRFKDGLPALAIQWGAIGEVGLVAELQEDAIEMEIGGTLQQNVTSCLDVLDILLKQKESPIVASMVVAQKRKGIGSPDNIVDAVANIIGLKDLKAISLHSTLAELGMDSMTAVEIKQTLEREYDVFLAPSDMQTMTFAKLMEIQEQKENNTDVSSNKDKKSPSFVLNILMSATIKDTIVQEPDIQLPSLKQDNSTGSPVLLIPGIESLASMFIPLTSHLNRKCIGFQISTEQYDSISHMAKYLYPHILKYVTKNEPFIMVGHSFGVLIALELIVLLEANNCKGHLICVDGSPELLKKLINIVDLGSEALLQTSIIIRMMEMFDERKVDDKDKAKLFKCETFKERIQMGLEISERDFKNNRYNHKDAFIAVEAAYNRLNCVKNYEKSFDKLKSKISLLKPKYDTVDGLTEDLKLSDLTEQPVDIHSFEGTHFSILENAELANYINAVTETDIKLNKN